MPAYSELSTGNHAMSMVFFRKKILSAAEKNNEKNIFISLKKANT